MEFVMPQELVKAYKAIAASLIALDDVASGSKIDLQYILDDMIKWEEWSHICVFFGRQTSAHTKSECKVIFQFRYWRSYADTKEPLCIYKLETTFEEPGIHSGHLDIVQPQVDFLKDVLDIVREITKNNQTCETASS